MAAKIPVHVHVGVTPLNLPPDLGYAGMRVTITGESGGEEVGILPPDEVPVPDEGGNLAYTLRFTDVQSGEGLHVEVVALDGAGNVLGLPVTHEVQLAAVPDDPAQQYYAPQSIYVTTA